MSDMERSLRAMVATKQLEIDKLKRKIKEMEDDNQNRQRNTSDRKKDKRSKPSDVSDK